MAYWVVVKADHPIALVCHLEWQFGININRHGPRREDRDRRTRTINDTLALIGIATSMPVPVLGKPLGYGADVMQGRVQPIVPLDAARGMIGGAASPESKR